MIVLVLIAGWLDLSRTKTAHAELAAHNEQLSNALATIQSELSAANNELDVFKSGDAHTAVKKELVKTERVITPSVEQPETLFLQEPSVNPTESGLIARFGFLPEDNAELPKLITLVVRVPSDSEAKILSLKPVDVPRYSTVEFLVNPKGNLGMIEGSPSDLKALMFELTVSAPVKAMVRGSNGIKAFEMDITSTGCAVRKL